MKDQPKVEQQTTGLPNVSMPTLGGRQFWTDHVWRDGWRIQQNAITGHWRLLDPSHVRHAWGTRAACDQILREKTNSETDSTANLTDANADHFVILLHGLIRSSGSMASLAEHLEQQIECRTICFEYASTRASMTDHAQALREVVERLPPNATLTFVAHSMGNIVVRHAVGDWQRAQQKQVLSRMRAVVMLGPPNQGAAIARQLSKLKLYEWVMGQGGLELGPQWDEFESKLAIPPCPFGIIAGRLPEITNNPLVGAAGDFVVSVEETKLDGAQDFLEVRQIHSLLMNDAAVQKAVANFIDHHSFD